MANVLFFQNCAKTMSGSSDKPLVFGQPVLPFNIADDFFVGFAHNLDYSNSTARIELEGVDPFQPVGFQQIYFNLFNGPRTNLTPYYIHKEFFDSDNVEDFAFASGVYNSATNLSVYNLYVYSGSTGNRIYEKYYHIEEPLFVGDVNHDGQPEVLGYRYDTRLYYLFTIDPENPNYREDLKQDERLYKYRKNGQEYDITNYLYYYGRIPDVNGNGYDELRFMAYYTAPNGHQDFIALIVDSKDLDINNPLFTYVEEYPFSQEEQTVQCYNNQNLNFCKYNVAIEYRDNRLYVTGKEQLKVFRKQTDNTFVLETATNYPPGYRAVRNDYYRPRNDIQFDQKSSPKFMIQLQSVVNGAFKAHVAWYDRATNTFDLSVTNQILEITQCGSDCYISDYEVHKRDGKTYAILNVGQPNYMGLYYVLNLTDNTQIWKGRNYSGIWTKRLYLIRKRE